MHRIQYVLLYILFYTISTQYQPNINTRQTQQYIKQKEKRKTNKLQTNQENQPTKKKQNSVATCLYVCAGTAQWGNEYIRSTVYVNCKQMKKKK